MKELKLENLVNRIPVNPDEQDETKKKEYVIEMTGLTLSLEGNDFDDPWEVLITGDIKVLRRYVDEQKSDESYFESAELKNERLIDSEYADEFTTNDFLRNSYLNNQIILTLNLLGSVGLVIPASSVKELIVPLYDTLVEKCKLAEKYVNS
ncbi:hypothetical protein HOK51_11485 [Candidatus Woesearchaeota archaeon]|jgi:hypothetical protein|nr:hypothetical protein [Candidatus Woesearchaeota archaeon]MBT6520444.1 hypothetical protein [Candidatus Woesearchaeota archaeon]MBT7367338.1 hypothetical protein [Candidatus Woesearchaeota archaeon]